MMPDKIVIVNDRSVANGGATSLALLSARLFAEAGLEVVFVTGDSGEAADLPPDVQIAAFNGKPLLEMPPLTRVAKGLFNREALAKLQRVIQVHDTPGTIYHLHGWAQILSPSILAALSKVEDRLVIHAHDFFHACPNGTYFNFRNGTVCELRPLGHECLQTNCDKRSMGQKSFRVARMLVKRQLLDLAKTRALVATIHPDMLSWLEKAGISRNRMRSIRNPVRPFRSERVRAESNSDLVFIGRVEPEKGVEVALEAASQAGRRMRIIGDGSERQRLAEKYPDAIWEGWRSHEEIAVLVQHARALIMPSQLPEPFGLVSLEALQSGIPLVAFADSFIAREASEMGCAFVAKSRSIESLADAIRELDDEQVIAMASRRAFEETPALSSTIDTWRDQLLELYEELLSSSAQLDLTPERPVAKSTLQEALVP